MLYMCRKRHPGTAKNSLNLVDTYILLLQRILIQYYIYISRQVKHIHYPWTHQWAFPRQLLPNNNNNKKHYLKTSKATISLKRWTGWTHSPGTMHQITISERSETMLFGDLPCSKSEFQRVERESNNNKTSPIMRFIMGTENRMNGAPSSCVQSYIRQINLVTSCN